MILFVGLGNPGRAYFDNRHNIGFMAVEAIARAAVRARVSPAISRPLPARSRSPASASSCCAANLYERIRPCGRRGCALSQDRAEDIVVFHDELDLPPGKVRVKTGGGNAGHNGLKSITAHIGNDYRRVRIGIGHPGDRALVHNYVLAILRNPTRPGSRLCAASSPPARACWRKATTTRSRPKCFATWKRLGSLSLPA